MGKAKTPSPEDVELFEETFRDAKPLAKRKPRATRPAPAKAVATPAEPAASPPQKSGRAAGIDGNTAERLRRGMLSPEARLDLHGLTESAAHRALVTFLRVASARGFRLVLVVTGKGRKPAAPDAPFDLELEARARGVLRTMTPRWLAEPGLADFVADVSPSHRRHGEDGALYVYLRKKR